MSFKILCYSFLIVFVSLSFLSSAPVLLLKIVGRYRRSSQFSSRGFYGFQDQEIMSRGSSGCEDPLLPVSNGQILKGFVIKTTTPTSILSILVCVQMTSGM